MLNLIYAGSLAVSVAIFPAEPILSFQRLTFIQTQPPDAAFTLSMSSARKQQMLAPLRLAKGKRYESDYRIDADRARERHRNDRENYRYNPYEVEYDRDSRGRIYRDAEQRRREENLESEQPRYQPRNRSRHQEHRSRHY